MSECDLKLAGCTALTPAPVTVVNVGASQDQFVVCRSCLETMIREGEWQVRHSKIQPIVDLVVQDGIGRSVLAVEAKMPPRSSVVNVEQWASSIRRNLIAHGALANAPYFLMFVFPDTGFLWSSPFGFDNLMPDYTFSLSEISPSGPDIPATSESEAGRWAEKAIGSLLTHDLQPQGLWWTESGLKRALDQDGLELKAHLKV